VWQGIAYRVLADAAAARPLFDFAAVAWPPPSADLVAAWGAFVPAPEREQLVGAVVIERGGRAMLLHGPVVTSDSTPLEIAAQLVAATVDHASALGARTVFARPQGLDRVWVRFGFIPVPEGALPAALAGRPGRGLFAWRGGSALWSLRDTEPD
jgi:hypothetical protein